MAAAAQTQNPALLTTLVEEKHFDIKLERSSHLLKDAIEHAIGAPLVEIAHGMWTARYPSGRWQHEEVTVRALPTDQGTSVEVRIEHHTNPMATTMFALAAIAGSILVLPLLYLIMAGQERQRENARARLIRMHKIWTEVASAVGAPLRAGYRDRPERTRVRVAEEPPAEEEEVSADGETDEKERAAG